MIPINDYRQFVSELVNSAKTAAKIDDDITIRLAVTETQLVNLLKDKGTVVSVTDVIGVQMPNVPGGLAKILALLAEKDINIEYMYAFIATVKENAYVVLRVANNELAEQVLKDTGMVLLAQEDINNL